MPSQIFIEAFKKAALWDVKKANDFKCVKCPATQNIEAHHIYSFASFPELRLDPMNGIPLCNFHHKMTPNHGSKEKAFSQQIINSQ